MSLGLVPLLLAAGLSFRDVDAWKFSEARQEKIPALSATLENTSDDEWTEARLRVTVHCTQGSSQTYEVQVAGIEPGSQYVQQTAFDALGRVQACDGPASVEFIDGKKVDPARRQSYLILGFVREDENGPTDWTLGGIVDYRGDGQGNPELRRLLVGDSGVLLGMYDGVALYAFRVEPGHMGLQGFLLDRNANAQSPVSRFSRFFEVPPGTAAFAGVFRFEPPVGNSHSALITIEPGEDLLQTLQEGSARVLGRPVARVHGVQQTDSLLIKAQ